MKFRRVLKGGVYCYAAWVENLGCTLWIRPLAKGRYEILRGTAEGFNRNDRFTAGTFRRLAAAKRRVRLAAA